MCKQDCMREVKDKSFFFAANICDFPVTICNSEAEICKILPVLSKV